MDRLMERTCSKMLDSKELADVERYPRLAASDAQRAHRRRLWDSVQHAPAARALLGTAVGDAFGFGIEFQDASWIRQRVVAFDAFPQSPVVLPRYARNSVRGFYSDDTEMTVALMKALTATAGHSGGTSAVDRNAMLTAWRAEWECSKQRPPPALPGEGRAGHGSILDAWEPGVVGGSAETERLLAAMRAAQAARADPGNAPPMRALPLAMVSDRGERERLAVENADATHPHPKARAASLGVVSAARFLIAEGGPSGRVIAETIQSLENSSLPQADWGATVVHLRELDGLPDYHYFGARFASMPRAVHALICGPQPIPGMEQVVVGDAPGTAGALEGLPADAMRTVGAVLYVLKWNRGPLDALTAAIDLGGDVDSVAALCLGIVAAASPDGLRFGEEGGLPWSLLLELEGVEYLVKHALEFDELFAHQQIA